MYLGGMCSPPLPHCMRLPFLYVKTTAQRRYTQPAGQKAACNPGRYTMLRRFNSLPSSSIQVLPGACSCLR
ncbi:hypothetical protein BD309DRAFT_944997 [Dichomitus squalens]|nr:hypothetical protein BD309DRAFT_944997 [Dichomitus squalens]